MQINVRDFGAKGDGLSLDSPAFERVLQQVVSAGGGKVIVPAGVYLCGSIDLPDNLTLHLEAGAQLLGCRDIGAYREHREPFQGKIAESGRLRHYLLGAFGRENIVIEGDGCIDGSGDAFWENCCRDSKALSTSDSPLHYRVLQAKNPRPVMLYFWKCRNLQLRDLRIVNSPSYTVWPQACDLVRLENLLIRNPRFGPNTDALDIDCCSNVTINACDIDAGDDCIALKSDTSRMNEDKPCERILVSNCLLSSSACGIRLGYEGDGIIRDCVFSNLSIYRSKNAIDILSLTPSPRPDFRRGTPISNIIFSNIVMSNVGRALYLWCGSESQNIEANPYRSAVRGLSFNSIRSEVLAGSFIGSKDGEAVSDLSFRDFSLHLQEQAEFQDQTPASYPGVWAGDFMPDALRLHRVNNCRFENVDLRVSPAPGQVRPYGQKLRWQQSRQLNWNQQALPENGELAW